MGGRGPGGARVGFPPLRVACAGFRSAPHARSPSTNGLPTTARGVATGRRGRIRSRAHPPSPRAPPARRGLPATHSDGNEATGGTMAGRRSMVARQPMETSREESGRCVPSTQEWQLIQRRPRALTRRHRCSTGLGSGGLRPRRHGGAQPGRVRPFSAGIAVGCAYPRHRCAWPWAVARRPVGLGPEDAKGTAGWSGGCDPGRG